MLRAFDVIVLGGGPGGYSCSLRSSDLGMSVALIEAEAIGGTCLHRGCVPTRAMLYAASLADAAGAPAKRWGIKTSFEGVDMTSLLGARDGVVQRNARAVERHLASAEVTVVRGTAELAGNRAVVVEGETLTARKAIVLATGSTPRSLSNIEPDGEHVLTSDHALALDRLPRSAIVVGGGAVGAEISQVWRALGAEVTLLELRETLIPFEDPDAGRELARSLTRRGIKTHVGADIRSVAITEDGVEASFLMNGEMRELSAEVLLMAIGRDPASSGFPFKDLGIRLEEGFVAPSDWSTLETSVPGVYAVGDLLPPPSPARAHVAFAEGMLAADAIAGERTEGIEYSGVPRVTHGLTETACVGYSESEARAALGAVDVKKMPLAGVAKGLMVGEPGMVKVISQRGGPIVGVQIVGPHASELIGEAVALTNFEASAKEASSLIHAHPTLSEALVELEMALAERPLHQR